MSPVYEVLVLLDDCFLLLGLQLALVVRDGVLDEDRVGSVVLDLLLVELFGDRAEVLEELDGLREVFEVVVDRVLHFLGELFVAVLAEVGFVLLEHLARRFFLYASHELR